jgi:hypothetical protein
MKSFFKPVAAAVFSLVSAAAFAAAPGPTVTINPTDTPDAGNNGSLMLFVFNSDTGRSSAFDLNLNISQISVADMTIPGTQITFQPAGGFLGNVTGNLKYTVVAADNLRVGVAANAGKGLYVTGNNFSAIPNDNAGIGGVGASANSVSSFQGNVFNADPSLGGCLNVNPCSTAAADDSKFWGNDGTWLSPYNQSLSLGAYGQPWAQVGTSVGFWSLLVGGTSNATQNLVKTQYTGGSWLLSSAGALTYTVTGGETAVPLPAAAWLLASGLLGLGTVARRRRQLIAA